MTEEEPLLDALVTRIGEHGPIGFDEYVGHALYAPGLGFYAGGGGAGRRHDFLTSPEVGPLFGAVLARALDAWWDELGRPHPFVVVEAGAGPGTLARSVLAASLRCAGSLRLVLVEVAEARWATHPVGVESRVELPSPGELGDGPVVVLANELLDNLPFGLVELVQPEAKGDLPSPDAALWRSSAVGGGAELRQNAETGLGGDEPMWCEVLVDVDRSGAGARLVEAYRVLDPARQGWCWGRAGRSAAVGTRLPVQADAAAWLAEALDLAAGGRVLAVDYASTTTDLARRPWTEWVRTYARHGRAGHPLAAPGRADVTCEVAVDQLALVRVPDLDRSQAEFLAAHGIDDLVAEGRAQWEAAGGAAGGLAAIAGRSRTPEAEALLDPTGLGAFRVLEWVGP